MEIFSPMLISESVQCTTNDNPKQGSLLTVPSYPPTWVSARIWQPAIGAKTWATWRRAKSWRGSINGARNWFELIRHGQDGTDLGLIQDGWKNTVPGFWPTPLMGFAGSGRIDTFGGSILGGALFRKVPQISMYTALDIVGTFHFPCTFWVQRLSDMGDMASRNIMNRFN